MASVSDHAHQRKLGDLLDKLSILIVRSFQCKTGDVSGFPRPLCFPVLRQISSQLFNQNAQPALSSGGCSEAASTMWRRPGMKIRGFLNRLSKEYAPESGRLAKRKCRLRAWLARLSDHLPLLEPSSYQSSWDTSSRPRLRLEIWTRVEYTDLQCCHRLPRPV